MSRNIYRQHCSGDYIDDAALKQGIADYKAAEAALMKLGPAFEITRKAISMTLISLEEFQQARKKK
jgi:hypothetical protein